MVAISVFLKRDKGDDKGFLEQVNTHVLLVSYRCEEVESRNRSHCSSLDLPLALRGSV